MKVIKQLEILNLVLLFKRFIGLFSLFFFLVAGISAKSYPKSYKLNDQAVYRLGGQVYFWSDIQKKSKSFNALKCTDKPPLLNELLGNSLGKIYLLEMDHLSALERKEIESHLYPFILIEKLKLTTLAGGKDTLSDFELAALGKKCALRGWAKFNTEERALLLSEVYLRDRFGSSSERASGLNEFRDNIFLKEKHEVLTLKTSIEVQQALQKSLK